MIRRYLLAATAGLFLLCTHATAADHVVYEGDSGPGKGKHIFHCVGSRIPRRGRRVPAIARIMAKQYGFKCTVLFGQTTEGLIKPGSVLIPGIDAIDDADMLFLFLRFVHPEDPWMAKFEQYLKRGGPVLGLRTTTHAFNGLKGENTRTRTTTPKKKTTSVGSGDKSLANVEPRIRRWSLRDAIINSHRHECRSDRNASRHERCERHACNGWCLFGTPHAKLNDIGNKSST